MSSAKAALESDTRVLAYEAGRKWGVRVNTISAGPLGSRAAKAIGFIDDMIKCAAVISTRIWTHKLDAAVVDWWGLHGWACQFLLTRSLPPFSSQGAVTQAKK